jgi:hypothetical protein
MISMKEIIEEIRVEMQDIISRTEKFRQNLESYEDQIRKIANERIRDVYGNELSVCLIGGFQSENWDPKIYVYPFSDGDKVFLKINGKWSWYDEPAVWAEVYTKKIIEEGKFDPPFDSYELERDCKKLEDDLGIQVKIIEYNVNIPANPYNIDDLLEIYPTGKVLASGKLWSVGWDIPDRWAILELDDGKHIFYSTNGHGMGYDYHIEPDQDVEKFMQIVTGNSGYSPVPAHTLTKINKILFEGL